jgi:hypothetical protein
VVDFPVESLEHIETMRKRPIFYLLAVDAPVKERFNRMKELCPGASLEDFIETDNR